MHKSSRNQISAFVKINKQQRACPSMYKIRYRKHCEFYNVEKKMVVCCEFYAHFFK